ncbi:MAG: FAD-dependent oxidoreductase [Actinomycetota bacterium]
MSSSEPKSAQALIAGGGIAGLEALMALRDLAGDRVRITLVAPDPDFVYKPLIVEEPFSSQPADQRALAPVAEEFEAEFVQQGIVGVDPAGHSVELSDGSKRPYDKLMVCVGARPREAFPGVVTLRTDGQPLAIDELLREAAAGDSKRIAFLIPPGRSWPLPVYELALMAQRRARELELRDVQCCIVTPEESPLIAFGRAASDSVASLLEARGILVHCAARAKELSDRGLVLSPGDSLLEAERVVSLPVLEGPRLAGLPADEDGFILIDGHAHVRGVEDVYAAGDGTNFPIKHGGLGTQQADAAAEHIAADLGADVEPKPFRPIVRGKLITGDESLYMQQDAGGGGGEVEASPDSLWWPPQKVSGRYLAPWLGHETPRLDQEPPAHSIDVEVSLPHEWHEEPMALDPHRTPEVD